MEADRDELSMPLGTQSGASPASPQHVEQARAGVTAGPVLLALAGLCAAAAASPLVERFHDYFRLRPETIAKAPQVLGGNQQVADEIAAETRMVHYLNTSTTFLLVGAIFAAVLGAAEGIARKSVRSIGFKFAIGLCGGALLGGIGGLVAALIAEIRADPASVFTMLRTAASHAAAWSSIGMAAALAMIIPARRRVIWRSVALVLSAALVAAFLYAISASLLFPMENSELAVPSGAWNRLYWMLLAGGTVGLFLSGAAYLTRRQTAG